MPSHSFFSSMFPLFLNSSLKKTLITYLFLSTCFLFTISVIALLWALCLSLLWLCPDVCKPLCPPNLWAAPLCTCEVPIATSIILGICVVVMNGFTPCIFHLRYLFFLWWDSCCCPQNLDLLHYSTAWADLRLNWRNRDICWESSKSPTIANYALLSSLVSLPPPPCVPALGWKSRLIPQASCKRLLSVEWVHIPKDSSSCPCWLTLSPCLPPYRMRVLCIHPMEWQTLQLSPPPFQYPWEPLEHHPLWCCWWDPLCTLQWMMSISWMCHVTPGSSPFSTSPISSHSFSMPTLCLNMSHRSAASSSLPQSMHFSSKGKGMSSSCSLSVLYHFFILTALWNMFMTTTFRTLCLYKMWIFPMFSPTLCMKLGINTSFTHASHSPVKCRGLMSGTLKFDWVFLWKLSEHVSTLLETVMLL